jgi:hypothetical protein
MTIHRKEVFVKKEALTKLKVADEVWIAAALLHREWPDCVDFSTDEIVERARREGLHEPFRPGVYVHVVQHCVANRQPNPGRYRMLIETSRGRRRLFRNGDAYHPDREKGKITPDRGDLPQQYEAFVDWYNDWARNSRTDSDESDPLLRLRGTGAHLWADETPDEYVERLREGWE